ncbi:MAG: S8 family peptidase [Bacillaceae bacterium]|nr:S8 family peptidase [Bacillaceae bacterium]
MSKVMVFFRDRHSVKQNLKFIMQHGLKISRKLDDIHAIVCHANQVSRILNAANKRDIVEIEKEIRVRLHARERVPWGVKRIGAPRMWQESTGRNVRIGVIDTGIDAFHPELRGRVARGIHMQSPRYKYGDLNGHGTHVSGIIASAHNRQGIKGIAPGVLLYNAGTFDQNGNASSIDIAEAIQWCMNQHVNVINMSFGSPKRSEAISRMVKAAYNRGITLVASAGNNDGGPVDYPAKHPEVIAVGAINRNNKISPFSSRGKDVTIYAPGEKILSTWTGNSYKRLDGTSMAAAHVSGMAALLLAKNPGLPPRQIQSLLIKHSKPLKGTAGSGYIRFS